MITRIAANRLRITPDPATPERVKRLLLDLEQVPQVTVLEADPTGASVLIQCEEPETLKPRIEAILGHRPRRTPEHTDSSPSQTLCGSLFWARMVRKGTRPPTGASRVAHLLKRLKRALDRR